ncbi:MAG: hypothetical protein KC413_10605 [Anaerolineales bacterium]|nr:hypothetical protein [Anaerolineales bacterium]
MTLLAKPDNLKIRMQTFLRMWGIWLILLLAVLLLAYALTVELRMTDGVLGVPLDDAWIHYQYARNLSQGDGFTYVPGVPTAGSTAPLWTLLLAGVGLFTHNFLVPSLALSVLFFLLTIWLTYRLTLDLTANWAVALLAAAGVALTGRLLWASLSAMEVTLFAALSVGAVWAYQRRGLGVATAALFALASQTRPEGHVLFALVVLDAVWVLLRTDTAKRPFSTWRLLMAAIAIYGLIQLPYALFSLSVTGKPLPNTFYAKSRTTTFYSWRTLRETWGYHWRDNAVSLLLLPFGLAYLWRCSRIVGAWLVGLLLLMPIIVPLVWHHGRYNLPLLPFQMIVAAAGLLWLVTHLPRVPRPLWALLVGLFLLAGAWHVPAWARMLGYNTREIEEIDVEMGNWLAANIPAQEAIGIDDIGAIVFLGPRPIVDLNGLVSPEMWPVIDLFPEHDTAAMRLLAANGVRYLAIFPKWHALLVSDPQIATPIQRFTTDTHTIIGEQEAVVYEMDWPYRQQIAPEVERVATLGEAIRLRGFDQAASADVLSLTLYWESLTAVSASCKVFIHVMDEAGQIVAQVDRPPVDGLAPTHRWQPGDLVRDPYQISLPPDLPPGEYEVRVGLYTDETGRLAAVGDDIVDSAVVLMTWSPDE